jgi:hypothetical protein
VSSRESPVHAKGGTVAINVSRVRWEPPDGLFTSDIQRDLTSDVIDQRITLVLEREGPPLTLNLLVSTRAKGLKCRTDSPHISLTNTVHLNSTTISDKHVKWVSIYFFFSKTMLCRITREEKLLLPG